MLEIKNLQMRYGQGADAFDALKSVSLEIREAEFFTLLGPSGCGKTTLLRSIAGFVAPTGGTIELNGEDLLAMPPHRRPVNTVFQSYALFPHMTVAANIGFALRMLRRPAAEIRRRVDEMLDLVRMGDLAGRSVSQLSGGQQQRVALARALAPGPRLLLLDEPLSALDYKLRKEMQLELKRLQQRSGITFIFVTHDQEEALTMSDRIAVMNGGTLRQIGSPQDIYDHPVERFVADFIGETNFLPVQVSTVAGDGNLADLHLASGQSLRVALDRPAAGPGTVALRPEHVRLAAEGAGRLQGTLRQAVYSGTCSHLHVDIPGAGIFVLRVQNSGAWNAPPSGSRIDIDFADTAVQLLRS